MEKVTPYLIHRFDPMQDPTKKTQVVQSLPQSMAGQTQALAESMKQQYSVLLAALYLVIWCCNTNANPCWVVVWCGRKLVCAALRMPLLSAHADKRWCKIMAYSLDSS
jgi:hypothetical protein